MNAYDFWLDRHHADVMHLVRNCGVSPAKNLDDAGRCCGRKPIDYKRANILFCARCYREYVLDTGSQQPNWAWRSVSGGFIPSDTLVGSHVTTSVYNALKAQGVDSKAAKEQAQRESDKAKADMRQKHHYAQHWH